MTYSNKMRSDFVVRTPVNRDTTKFTQDIALWNADGTPFGDDHLSEADVEVLSFFTYDEQTRILTTNKAIETTLNSLYLGKQHKVSSGSENIFFTNLTSDINFFPMWGGLKDQSVTANQGASGFIPPSGRVYSDMFSLPLGGAPDPTTAVSYAGDNYFGINITGLGITTVAAENIPPDVRLEYRITIAGREVYNQLLPRAAARSSAGEQIYAGDQIEWWFDHPVDVRAGTTLFAEIHKVRNSDDVDLGFFQVRQGDTVDPNTGLLRYQATVHNRIFTDKDLELISPYLKYAAMDFTPDASGSVITMHDLTLVVDTALASHPINTLEAVANGTTIDIKLRGGKKVIVEALPVSGASISGVLVNSVLNQAVSELNTLFTTAMSFSSQGNPVTGFAMSGDDLTLTLTDGTSFTQDVTTFGVDTNNFVASGTLSGSDLVLTMDDSTTVTIDASSLAVDEDTTISLGSLVGNTLTLTASDSSTVTIDVTALNVDENLHVVSGVLTGTDVELTMSDASVVTVAVAGLAIDNDTTITGGSVVGTDIQLSLSDASIIIIDATSLATGTSTQVASGAVVGSDLVLTMADATTVTIDAANLVSGSTLSAVNDRWFISYGTNADTEVGATSMNASVRDQGPYYFGRALARGEEMKFNMQTGNQLRLGVWDGPEVATAYNANPSMADHTNWGTVFSFANGSGKFTSATNTDVTTYHASGYSATLNAPMSVRFGSDGHLTLLDLSGGTETIVAKTIIALSVTEFNVQFGGFNGSLFPNAIVTTSGWTVSHSFDGTDTSVIDGILDHTVIETSATILPGEKFMIHFDEQGVGDYWGTDYTNATTGIVTAEEQLVRSFQYQTNESFLSGTVAESAWDYNTLSSGYFIAGSNLPSYRVGGAGTTMGMVSLRYMTDNSLVLFHEDHDEIIATAKVDGDGSPISVVHGVKGNRAFGTVPVVSKQTIGQGSQPDNNFVPTVADQTVTVIEATVLNFQIVSSDNIVNQFVELDAPSWMSLNQTTGVLSGTAPAHAGTAADTIVVNCKAGNAIGGTVEFTVTVTVGAGYANTKSLTFNGTSTWLQGNPTTMTALERATNGDGSAWTMSFWVKPTSTTATQTLLVYGAGDDYNGGAITVKQQAGTSLVFNYGTVYDSIIAVVGSAFTAGQWTHVMITFDGGTTGVDPNSMSDYFSRFEFTIDGSVASPFFTNAGNGYDGALSGAVVSDNIFRIGRASNVHNNYSEATINQVAIWGTDQTANAAAIYNGGSTQDLSSLTTPPTHWWEPETSTTAVNDRIGSANLVAYNFVGSDLVSDTP